MDAVAKPQVPIRRSVDVEAIRIGKLGYVPIGCRKDRQYQFTFLECVTQIWRIPLNHPRQPVQYRAKSEHLLDGRWQHFGVHQHFCPSVGMLLEAP